MDDEPNRRVPSGHGEVDLQFADEILLDEAEVTARLRETFTAPDYRPPRCPVWRWS